MSPGDRLVSILIPCFNAARFVAKTIESALDQTHKNIEIIVVDDGSTDNSAEVVANYGSVQLLRQKNAGVTCARNVALRRSRGDFIQYLDADDLISPDKIERQLACLVGRNEDCVATAEWGRFYTDPRETRF